MAHALTAGGTWSALRSMHWRLPLAVGVLVGLLLSGCSAGSPPPKPPPPPVRRAPAELAELAVHVHRLVSPPKTPEDEWDYHHMSGYTKGLREAFQVQLIRAGYTAVLSRQDPRDVVATIQADWPMDHAGAATLTIKAHGRVIDQLSAEIPIRGKSPYVTYLDEHAAVALVHAMAQSKALAAFARNRSVEEPLQIAAPDAEPVAPPAAEPTVVAPATNAPTAAPTSSQRARPSVLDSRQ